MTHDSHDPYEALHDSAYAEFDAGNLKKASELFAQLIEARPDAAYYRYMRGLVHKYLCDWPTSLAENLKSQEMRDEPDEASLWNAGIAATAMGDWESARRCWRKCGLSIPEGAGPIEADFGVVGIRLNPAGAAETLYARRIDVVRARLDGNVPLPTSGYRYGDVVLHDGAATGRRAWGEGTVPVFNALQRMESSDYATYAVFAHCETEADAEALVSATGPEIGGVEDWTNMAHHCLRCSYGVIHRHEEKVDEWSTERNFGIAAQSRAAVDRLLENWFAAGAVKKGVVAMFAKGAQGARRVEAVESREYSIPEPSDGVSWWDVPTDE